MGTTRGAHLRVPIPECLQAGRHACARLQCSVADCKTHYIAMNRADTRLRSFRRRMLLLRAHLNCAR